MKLPLSSTEKLCRQYYQKFGKADYGKLKMEEKVSEEDYTESFHRLFLQAIHNFHEDMLIPSWSDIWILSSPRYMPVYWHSHDFIELIYVYGGTCIHRIPDCTEELKEGDIYILPPKMPHQIECMDDDTIVFHIMVRCSAFNSTFLSLLKTHNALSTFFARSIYDINSVSIRFASGADRMLKKLVREIYQESLSHDDFTAITMGAYFQLLCIELAKNHLSEIVVKENGKDMSFIPQILEYISKHYDTITMKALADQFGYSEGHIRRMLHYATGKNFKNIITEQRMIHVKMLLLDSNEKMDEIAEKTGCGDVRNLQRLFKATYGMTPSAYRKKVRETE